MKWNVIIGEAGTGKTWELSKRITEVYDKKISFVVLSATHSAVNNIYTVIHNNFNSSIPRDYFKTLHSFFRINYKTDSLLGPTDKRIQKIFIDEFSLINKKTLKKCLLSLTGSICDEITFCGDPLQLNPVIEDDESILVTRLRKYKNVPISIIIHVEFNLISSDLFKISNKTILKEQHRANDNCIKILHDIYQNKNYKQHFISIEEVLNKLLKEKDNVIYLASTYAMLQIVWNMIYNNNKEKYTDIIKQKPTNGNDFTTLYLYSGMKIIATQTDENYYNGEELVYDNFDQDLMIINAKNSKNEYITIAQNENNIFPISPVFLSTVHKSQGKGYDNVIICVDNLFEITMLYTAITRARKNIYFYTKQYSKREQTLEMSAHVDEWNELKKYISETVLSE